MNNKLQIKVKFGTIVAEKDSYESVNRNGDCKLRDRMSLYFVTDSGYVIDLAMIEPKEDDMSMYIWSDINDEDYTSKTRINYKDLIEATDNE